MTLLFTPEQYAVYEKAQQRISNKRRRRVGREEATTEMARLTLDAAPERSRARHQVVVHVDASTELAWIETERGLHVLTDDQRDQALAVGRVFVTTDSRTEGERSERGRKGRTGTERSDRGQEEGTAGEQSDRGRKGRTGTERSDRGQEEGKEGEQSERGRSATLGEDVGGQGLLDLDKARSKPGKVRAAVPMPTLRALFARARGRCERCSRRQGLQVHHCTPRSRGGTHDLDELKLFCEQCHRVGHDADFAGDPTWERARAKSRRRRQRKRPAEG